MRLPARPTSDRSAPSIGRKYPARAQGSANWIWRWADAPAPDGGIIGKVWLLAEWRVSKAQDHCGYGDGIRVAVANEAAYAPYYETALAPGDVPTDKLTANYISALRTMLEKSAENRDDAFENYMGEEKITSTRNAQREQEWNRERSMKVYDDNVGGFGNCLPGTAGGFLSWGGV